MNTTIKAILDDLYSLDPSLKQDEARIVPIIEKLLAHRPDARPDQAFVDELRMLLRERAATPSSTSLFSFLTMNKYIPAFVGAFLGIIITGPLVYTFVQSDTPTLSTMESDDADSAGLFSFSVSPTSNRAFGSLDQVQENSAMGFGGGGGGDAAMTSRPQSGGGGGGLPAVDAEGKMIAPDMLYPPEWVTYTLAFDGELPELPGQTVQVLKRVKSVNTTQASSILGSMKLGVLDMSAFNNAKVDSISMYQDTKYGYYVNVNLREGSIFINQNWEQWPHPESNCQTEACYNQYRIKPDQIPSDDKLIAIAQEFVSKYKIDLSQYGEPEVDNAWRVQYARAEDKSMVYVPEAPRVVYPLMIDGKPVYDEGGQKFGISINVNVRENRVSDAWGMMNQQYESSGYEAVTDEAKIREFITSYGQYPVEPMPGTTTRNVTVTLGTPTIGFVKSYLYDNTTVQELVVPALIFPVENVPEGEYFYNNSITVPLAKELFDRDTNQGGPIMPLAY